MLTDRKSCREPDCGHDMPLSMQHCPHCGRPRRFPNVDAAEMSAEITALDQRYQLALQNALKHNTAAVVSEFEKAVEQARAVMCCPFLEVHRLAKSDTNLAMTFYQRGVSNLEKGSHVFHGGKWDAIRAPAETALFGDDNKREIHFAALSLDDLGLTNYGDCSITLRTEMIAHRTTIFEENMLIFFKKRGANYWR